VGECNFYLKARFRTDAEARAAEPRLLALLSEGEDAYHFWQDAREGYFQRHRRHSPLEETEHQEAIQFWAEFRARFPLVCDYLGELVGTDDWYNGLAGHLSLVDPQRPRQFRPLASLIRRGPLLLLQLNDVWHCSSMELLERYCVTVGAVAARGRSESEYEIGACGDPSFDPFALILI
jgi:hypothetical protein